MGLDETGKNLAVARRENSVILIEEDYSTHYQGYDPNSAESHIIFSLMQNIHQEQSMVFASLIQNQFQKRAMRYNRGVKQAGLLVLWNTGMPSVLVETGYISNAKEKKYLSTKYGQEIIASAIFRAFREYKKMIENRSNFMISEEEKNTSTGSVTDKNEKTKNNTKTENKTIKKSEISYKVQLRSSKTKISLNSKIFKGLKEIEEIKIDGLYKYFIGDKDNFNDIVALQNKTRKKIPDAFVVAFKNGKIIPLWKAKKNE